MNDLLDLKVRKLVDEALAEDDRAGQGARFDFDGWGNYFLEEWKQDPEAVRLAWNLYAATKSYQSTK